jgi:hypothetical protein
MDAELDKGVTEDDFSHAVASVNPLSELAAGAIMVFLIGL